MQQAKVVETVHYPSLQDVPVSDWQALNATIYNPFHELSFLEVLEQSQVEAADYDYLLFYVDEQPVGTAVLSSFIIDLSLFIGREGWVQKLKQYFPKFFQTRILFCGTPISIGHANFHCKSYFNECLFALNAKMKTLAKERNISLLCVKELSKEELNEYVFELKTHKWFIGHSIPDTKMKVGWKSYQDYLLKMKSRYRRQVLDALSIMNGGVKPRVSEAEQVLQKHIEVWSTDEIDTTDFYTKYLAVMSRAEVKLETLNLRFFELLQKKYKEQLRYFVCRSENEILCYALCLQNGDNLHFLWTAKPAHKDEQNSYLNQLQAIVLYSINHGISYLHIGQTAYYPKMRMGACPVNRYLFFKSLNPLLNLILCVFRKIIFPPFPLKTVQPFKNET